MDCRSRIKKMSNPNYEAGVRFEREIIEILKKNLNKETHTIVRTAGSKSPVDIIIIKTMKNTGRKRVFTIQCKTKKNK